MKFGKKVTAFRLSEIKKVKYLTYNFVYGEPGVEVNKCLYSKENHAIYRVPLCYGEYSYATLKDIVATLEEN